MKAHGTMEHLLGTWRLPHTTCQGWFWCTGPGQPPPCPALRPQLASIPCRLWQRAEVRQGPGRLSGKDMVAAGPTPGWQLLRVPCEQLAGMGILAGKSLTHSSLIQVRSLFRCGGLKILGDPRRCCQSGCRSLGSSCSWLHFLDPAPVTTPHGWSGCRREWSRPAWQLWPSVMKRTHNCPSNIPVSEGGPLFLRCAYIFYTVLGTLIGEEPQGSNRSFSDSSYWIRCCDICVSN